MALPVRLSIILYVLAEIAGFMLAGHLIGIVGTLGLVVMGFVAGGVLLRLQGLATLGRLRADMAARRIPAQTLADGMLKAVAAVLLIVPGFLSDAVGLLLLLPPVRHAVRTLGTRRFETARARYTWRRTGPTVIELDDGEFRSGPSRDTPPRGLP